MDDHLMEDEALATAADYAPITCVRRVGGNLETTLPKPYLPTALIASDTNHPLGTPGHRHPNLSVLQQHAAIFDQDESGIVYPWETFVGLRDLGFNLIASLILAVVINGTLSYATLPGWIPSPFFPVYLLNIHKAKHGSDTGAYDTEGRILPANIELMFSKYARTVPDKFTLGELWHMAEGNRLAYDIFGWIASKLEWGVLYVLARDEEGFFCLKKPSDAALMEAYSSIVPR